MFVVLLSGCYSPQLSNPGFYCHAEDNPACPDGQQCLDGRCVGYGVVIGRDLGVDEGGVGGGPTRDDLMSVPVDLAKPQDLTPPVDFSLPAAPDLSKPAGSCGMSGALCVTNSDCCPGVTCLLTVCF